MHYTYAFTYESYVGMYIHSMQISKSTSLPDLGISRNLILHLKGLIDSLILSDEFIGKTLNKRRGF